MSTSYHIPVLTYSEACALYGRLCAKARRHFNRDDDASHILTTACQALSNSWDFSQGFPVSDLKHLTADDRTDFLVLLAYCVSDKNFPPGFDEINRNAFSDL
ncbi:MAG: hypothetical protein V4710_13645 [Verrucomicrobiota bacterium]